MLSRRKFLNVLGRAGIATASAPFWLNEMSVRAFAQSPGAYKAIVVVTMIGGNDGNNTIIPLDSSTYQAYSSLRGGIALPINSILPLSGSMGGAHYGMHPALQNVAGLYNSGQALVVANIGPLGAPVTKAQLAATPNVAPQSLFSHPAGRSQWESASSLALPSTGWGGRIADLISSQSGSLPPVLTLSEASIFTVGKLVQGICVQNAGGGTYLQPVPTDMASTILAIAQNDAKSTNALVAQAAEARLNALQQQALLVQAKSAGPSLQTQFPKTAFGASMQTIAQIIAGRSFLGASRQIFYAEQGNYDTHATQITLHANQLSELDGGIGAFMQALTEMGLQNDVLICTHSDFNRTYISNTSSGTDHAWGNHQIVIGGGIAGGRIVGTIPDPVLGGSNDLNGYGIWIPTLSVTQLTAGIGLWMGLTQSQVGSVFPDLQNFSSGAIKL